MIGTVFVLSLTNAQASVVINETNFPDDALRNYASQYDEDGNGTLSDAETDYRLAPLTKTYTVWIDKATPAFSFEKAAVTAHFGDDMPENKLSIGLYDGEVQYASSDEQIATVSQSGKVTALAIGEVTITATGAETSNCYEAQQAQYQLTITDPSGISTITYDATGTGKAYDLNGRKINLPTARKGVYIVEGKKVVKN